MLKEIKEIKEKKKMIPCQMWISYVPDMHDVVCFPRDMLKKKKKKKKKKKREGKRIDSLSDVDFMYS